MTVLLYLPAIGSKAGQPMLSSHVTKSEKNKSHLCWPVLVELSVRPCLTGSQQSQTKWWARLAAMSCCLFALRKAAALPGDRIRAFPFSWTLD